MTRDPVDRRLAWVISGVALALLVLAAIDLVRPGSGGSVDLNPGAESVGTVGEGAAGELIELHRLLPGASADLGRAVQVAGTIVGQVTTKGFWVQDLRDNVVFVGTADAFEPGQLVLHTGGLVRVRGLIAQLSPSALAERLDSGSLILPSGASLVRDIELRALSDGIEVLRD